MKLAPLHFLSKEFEILDLDPPINATSHYGACHFNLTLTVPDEIENKRFSLYLEIVKHQYDVLNYSLNIHE